MGELFDRVCSLSVLMDAWKRVKTKKAAGGLDRVTVQDFDRDFHKNFEQLRHDLQSGKYIPEPLERINASKMDGSGETRPLSLPSVRDKIAQQAVKTVVEPIFDPLFLDCSYAYRPGKGPRKAFKRVNHYLTAEKRKWAVLGDFDRFFDMLVHDLLLKQVEGMIDDADIIRLIRMWMKIGFVKWSGDYVDMHGGVGQGSVISPLLANVYAHPLDEFMVQKGHAYIRYSDNLIILCYSRQEALRAFDDLKFFTEQGLKLHLNKEERPVRALDRGFVFLGIYYRDNIRAISNGKMAKIRQKIMGITRPGENPDALMEKLNRSLDGTRRYYGVLQAEAQFIEIDNYLSERMTPLLAGYLQEGMYRNVADLVMYLTPLQFLSTAFNRDKEDRLKELAGMALKKNIGQTQKGDRVTPQKKGVEEGVKAADRAVSRRKQRYLKNHAMASEIVVSTHGAFVGKTGNRLVVKLNRKIILTQQLDKLKNVVVATNGVTLSSDLIRECSSRKISIVFTESHGPPYAMVHTPSHPHARLGLAQLEAIQNGQGLKIAKRIVIGKIRNQLNLIKFYGRSRKNDIGFQEGLDAMESEIDGLVNDAKKFAGGLEYDMVRDRLFSVEGRAASAYWGMARQLLPDDVEFPGRRHKGASDLVNSLLNYGYGILYARVWQAVAFAGLNPHLSFLHASQTAKPSLVFDLIEEFRCQAVDRAVFTMFTRGEELKIERKSGQLTETTKKKVIRNVLERLTSLAPYRGKKKSLGEVIRLQSSHLAACLAKGKKYKPFIGRY